VRFDLLQESWIPVTLPGGGREEVSLLDALLRAHQLAGLADQSPLVEVALHRLLLAVLHRAYRGPRGAREWQAIWSSGRFDEDVLRAYLDLVADRWDLFHPVYPWCQTGSMAAGYKARPVRSLDLLSAAYGAVPALFDGTPDSSAGVSPGQAARWLLAHQAYGLGGATSRLPGESMAAMGAPLAKAAAARVTGTSLFRTLCLNLTPYRHREDDRPAWERGGAANGERRPDGLVDLLTWQARRLCLLQPEDPGEVRHVQIAAGWGFPQDRSGKERVAWQPTELEPMVAWRPNHKGDISPLAVSADRALWRDSTALLVDGEQQPPPLVVSWVRDLAASGLVTDTDVVGLEVTGFATGGVGESFKIMALRSERVPLTLAGRSRSAEAAELAERVWQALRGAILWARAPHLESVPADQLAKARSLTLAPAGAAYWSGLEPDFRWWAGSEDDLAEWALTVDAAAWRAFAGVADDEPTSRDFGRWARARRMLSGGLRKELEGSHDHDGTG
jgi:CRISPR system Cascade subunit CasA